MAPHEQDKLVPVDETVVAVSHTFEFSGKAMELPFVHDAVAAATKLHTEATTYPYYNQVEAAVGGILTKAEETITPHVPGTISSTVAQLDTLACGGLNQMTAMVPALKLPTGELVTATTGATFTFASAILDFLAQFMVIRAFISFFVSFLAFIIRILKSIQPEDTTTPVVGIIYTILSFVKPVVEQLEALENTLESAVEKNEGKIFGYHFTYPFYRCVIDTKAAEKRKEE